MARTPTEKSRYIVKQSDNPLTTRMAKIDEHPEWRWFKIFNLMNSSGCCSGAWVFFLQHAKTILGTKASYSFRLNDRTSASF